MNPELARYHRLVLFPGAGAAIVWRARNAASGEDRDELTRALRCQLGGLAVWLLHGVLQAGIGGVAVLMNAAPYTDPALEKAATTVLWVSTGLNVIAWVAEWAVVVAAGLAASRGKPYPLTRREKKAAAAAGASAEQSGWKAFADDG